MNRYAMFVYAFIGYISAILLALLRNSFAEILSCVPASVAIYFSILLLASYTEQNEYSEEVL